MSDPRTMPTPSEPGTEAEARGAIYALLANAWRYPDDHLVAAGRGLGASAELDKGLESSEELKGVADPRKQFLRLCQRPECMSLERLRASYARLFGWSVRGKCPPYELEYGRSEIIQQTAELADIGGFYRAFGLEILETAYERPDHAAVECEFMAILCAKEAWGRATQEDQLAESCFDAQRLFLRDHLARWLPAFAHRVMREDEDEFYGRLASWALAFITEECRNFDIEIGPQWLELRPSDPAQDASLECDSAGCGPSAARPLVELGIEPPSDTKDPE